MPQPYDYTLKIADPTNQVLQALQIGVQIEGLRGKGGAEKQETQLQEAIAALGENPTPQAIARLMLQYPQLSKDFKPAYDVLNTEQQKARLNEAQQVYAALEANQPQVAQERLNVFSEAYRNNGDETTAKTLTDLSELIGLSPETAKISAGLFLASAMGPEEFESTFSTLTEKPMKPIALGPKERLVDVSGTVLTEPLSLQDDSMRADEIKAALRERRILPDNPDYPFEFEKLWQSTYGKAPPKDALTRADQVRASLSELGITPDDPTYQTEFKNLLQQMYGKSPRTPKLQIVRVDGKVRIYEDGKLKETIDDQYSTAKFLKLQKEIAAIDRDMQISQSDRKAQAKNDILALDDGINAINSIIESPNLNMATGLTGKALPSIWGGDSKEIESRIEDINNKIFLAMVPTMRGMGPLSDAEGKALRSSMAGLNIELPFDTTIRNLRLIRKIFNERRGITAEKYADILTPKELEKVDLEPMTLSEFQSLSVTDPRIQNLSDDEFLFLANQMRIQAGLKPLKRRPK